MSIKDILKIVDDHLKLCGFQKKGKTWYKENKETITAFALDRSRWGEIYYVYLCVMFKEINTFDTPPKFYKFHSRLRLESIGENTEEYLNLENNMSDVQRNKKLMKLFEKSLLILNKEETVSGFKELLSQYNPREFGLYIEAQKYLGIHVD